MVPDSMKGRDKVSNVWANLWGGAGTILLPVLPLHGYQFLPGVLEVSDSEATYDDWQIVGGCLHDAMDNVGSQYGFSPAAQTDHGEGIRDCSASRGSSRASSKHLANRGS